MFGLSEPRSATIGRKQRAEMQREKAAPRFSASFPGAGLSPSHVSPFVVLISNERGRRGLVRWYKERHQKEVRNRGYTYHAEEKQIKQLAYSAN